MMVIPIQILIDQEIRELIYNVERGLPLEKPNLA